MKTYKRTCLGCSKEFTTRENRPGEGLTCSLRCARLNEWKSGKRNLTGPRNGKWVGKHCGYSTAYSRDYYKKNPEKARAHKEVQIAKRNGTLKRQPCEVCGKFPADAHHDDYSKPLDVRWLCPKHHNDITHRLQADALR